MCATHGWNHIQNPCPACQRPYIQSADSVGVFKYYDTRDETIGGMRTEIDRRRINRIENGVWFGLYPEVNRGRVSEFLGQGGPAEDIKYLLSVIKELEKEIGELKK